MIYVIGDSHALRGFYSVYPFCVFHAGPRTAWGLSSHDDQIGAALHMVPPGVRIVFVFGYVDARRHIEKIAERDRREIIDVAGDAVNSYMKYVTEKIALGFRIMPMTIPPLGRDDHDANNKEKIKRSADFFNVNLIRYCENFNIQYIDARLELCCSDGYREESAAYDRSHIGKKLGETVRDKYFCEYGKV